MNSHPTRYPGRDLEAMTDAANYHRWIARHFGPFLRGRVAEVGAGTGLFTECLLRLPIGQIVALEPADNLHAQLQARFSGNPRVRVVNQLLRDAQPQLPPLDGLVYCNVLEHVEDDAAEVRLCAQLLAPGGALCAFVPALPWLMSDFDRSIGHYRRYLPGRLRELTNAAGLQLRELRWFDSLGVLPWLIMMKALGGGLSPASVQAYDRWIVPWLLPLEARVRPPFGKSLLMVAVRSAGNVVSKSELSEQALGRKLGRFDRSLDMHVSNLRRKLGPLADGRERIGTIRGVGYQLIAD